MVLRVAADHPRQSNSVAAATLLLAFAFAGTAHAAVVFNVQDYGAKADGATNNTAAFSACLDALVAAGGGRMYLPAGVYLGRIVVPAIPALAQSLAVEIVGVTEPMPRFGTVGTWPYRSNATSIVQSLSASGPAVITAASYGGGFSAVFMIIRNLEVRTYDNPAIGGVDLSAAQQCKLENVFINTDIYDIQAAEPTHGTVGLATPAVNNAAWTILRSVAVTGYGTGILANEHTDGDGLSVCANVRGISFARANHASRFGRVGAFRNAIHLAVLGAHGFSVQQLAIENAGPGQLTDTNRWQALRYDISDPGNQGAADVTYWVVEGNVGPISNFSKEGGTSVRARRIGSAPACAA